MDEKEYRPPARRICCATLDRYLRAAQGPFRFHTRFREVHACVDESSYNIWFCPWCGKKLPESQRHRYFTKPSKREALALVERLKGVRSLAEVKRRLGEPDREYRWTRRLASVENAPVVQFTYVRKTLNFCVQQLRNGRIQLSYGGKYKGSR